jgi:hypothetical protein
MITRRSFAFSGVAGLLSLPSPLKAVAAEQKLDISLKEFGFEYSDAKLKLTAKDVTIGGLSLPKFTWAWVGSAVASSLLAPLGNAVFSALLGGLLQQGKSMEQYLQELLSQMRILLRSELQENDLRNYTAAVNAYVAGYKQYLDTPSPHDVERLNRLVDGTNLPFYQLASLGFMAYRPFMILAGLRLAILQESIRRKMIGQASFKQAREEATVHFNKMKGLVYQDTEPAVVVYRLNGADKWNPISPRRARQQSLRVSSPEI